MYKRQLQNWVIIPRIKEVSGVADVTNFGGITTQFQGEVDLSKLEQYNLSLSQVVEAIENNNANVGGSVLLSLIHISPVLMSFIKIHLKRDI